MITAPWQLSGDQLTLYCHIQPAAKQTRLCGLHDGCIKIQLQSPPLDGKANKALIAFLAKLVGVAKTKVIIKKGLNSRRKTILIDGIEAVPKSLESL